MTCFFQAAKKRLHLRWTAEEHALLLASVARFKKVTKHLSCGLIAVGFCVLGLELDLQARSVIGKSRHTSMQSPRDFRFGTGLICSLAMACPCTLCIMQANPGKDLCWVQISSRVPGREPKQCRHRWVNSCQ